MVRWTDHLNMTIAVDWDIKPSQNQTYCLGYVHNNKVSIFIEVVLDARFMTAFYFARVCTGLKSTWIYWIVLKSPWKLNLPYEVLEKHSKALKSPRILPFTWGFITVVGDLNQYKIVAPLFVLVQHMLHQIKAPHLYTNFLKLISLIMDSSISEVEF